MLTPNSSTLPWALSRCIERVGDLVWLGQVIRAMEHVQVDPVGAESPERGLARGEDMLLREVIAVRRRLEGIALPADRALAADQDPVAQSRNVAQHAAEDLLAHAITLDVGMVEVRVARFERGQDRAAPGRLLLRRQTIALHPAMDPHAAIRQSR